VLEFLKELYLGLLILSQLHSKQWRPALVLLLPEQVQIRRCLTWQKSPLVLQQKGLCLQRLGHDTWQSCPLCSEQCWEDLEAWHADSDSLVDPVLPVKVCQLDFALTPCHVMHQLLADRSCHFPAGTDASCSNLWHAVFMLTLANIRHRAQVYLPILCYIVRQQDKGFVCIERGCTVLACTVVSTEICIEESQWQCLRLCSSTLLLCATDDPG